MHHTAAVKKPRREKEVAYGNKREGRGRRGGGGAAARARHILHWARGRFGAPWARKKVQLGAELRRRARIFHRATTARVIAPPHSAPGFSSMLLGSLLALAAPSLQEAEAARGTLTQLSDGDLKFELFLPQR